jgi:hypothetical protein
MRCYFPPAHFGRISKKINMNGVYRNPSHITTHRAETAESAAMCAKDVSLPTRAKTSLPHCGEVSVPD